MSGKHHIAVLGAGLMGHGIALTFARKGYLVNVFDPSPDTLQTLTQRVQSSLQLLGDDAISIADSIKLITPCSSVSKAVSNSDIVFEAAPEKLELKQALFLEVEQYALPTTIFASNTSVIQITRIMEGLSSPERALGTHWWNPPHQIPLVEIVKTQWTKADVADTVYSALVAVDKKPVHVEKDIPGFIGNRLQHALWREAISLVESGVCTAEAVDEVVKSSFGRRLAVLGPLENADLVGIELTQDIHKQVLFDLDTQKQPSQYLQILLDNGRTGMSSGAGFRDWETDDLVNIKAKIAEHLVRLERILPE